MHSPIQEKSLPCCIFADRFAACGNIRPRAFKRATNGEMGWRAQLEKRAMTVKNPDYYDAESNFLESAADSV
jgi:hypothetical protein